MPDVRVPDVVGLEALLRARPGEVDSGAAKLRDEETSRARPAAAVASASATFRATSAARGPLKSASGVAKEKLRGPAHEGAQEGRLIDGRRGPCAWPENSASASPSSRPRRSPPRSASARLRGRC